MTSLSDILRDAAKEKGLEPVRENLIAIGNELRETEGAEVLARRTVAKIKNAPQAVIDSIRNPKEAEELRNNLAGFKLIGVTADISIRFERAQKRGRAGDGDTLEEFKAREEKENTDDENAQQLSKCFEIADYTVDNSKGKEELYAQIDAILKKMDYKPYSRPSWDEYFMKMAYLAAERSTCLRHHVGAVMVRENQIISTGYNGAAKGIKDCTQLGCLRDQMGIASGTRHEICRAIHAEQNAIIQAASHSGNTKGAVVYCTHSPCIICAKMLVNAGIKRFVTSNEYPDPSYKELFAEAGVGFEVIARPEMNIQVLD